MDVDCIYCMLIEYVVLYVDLIYCIVENNNMRNNVDWKYCVD